MAGVYIPEKNSGLLSVHGCLASHHLKNITYNLYIYIYNIYPPTPPRSVLRRGGAWDTEGPIEWP